MNRTVTEKVLTLCVLPQNVCDPPEYGIGNVDCNIICELPRISPVRGAIIESLAQLIGASVGQVSVKGRTNEKQDSVGEGRAVVCQAIVLLTPVQQSV